MQPTALEGLENILNHSLATLIGDEQTAALKAQFDNWPVKERIPVYLHFQAGEKKLHFSAILHSQEKNFIIELKEIREQELSISFMDIYDKIKYVMLTLKKAQDVRSIGQIAVDELKDLTGFDKVMCYKFDENWNGTVIAEAKEEDMVPYLDLRFPASDVPRQSRNPYLTNPYRLIPDTNFTPAKLVPVLNPATYSFTDLSACNLWAVPKVHIEYLNNMEVQASMSVPIIVHEQLWGLISCHHKTPKYPDLQIRSAFELLSTIISTQVAAKEREDKLQYKTKVDELKLKILEQLYTDKDVAASFQANAQDMMKLFGIGGASLVVNNEVISKGKTPAEDHVKKLVRWVRRYHHEKICATQALSAEYEHAADFKDLGSGLLALHISHNGDYLLGYRSEVIQTVSWGGNPNEAINFEKDGKVYHPRNSFNVWKETVSDISPPWREEELEAAEKLRVALLEKMFMV